MTPDSRIDPHDVSDFQSEVLDASHSLPVLVDFWAPWCGPCRVLGPVLDKLASEANGRWRLAKVNTDENQSLMATYGIRGIPAVKLFSNGSVLGEFTGALPEHQVRTWLDEQLPTESGTRYAAALAAWESGDRTAARAELETALGNEASGSWVADARLRLARLIVFDEPERALNLLDGMELPIDVESVRHIAALMSFDPTLLKEAPAREGYAKGLAALRDGQPDQAIQSFIATVQADRSYEDDGARKAVVALFQTLGEDHPVTIKHRPLFNMSLY